LSSAYVGSSRDWHSARNKSFAYMTTTTTATITRPADRLRAALKQAGYNSRQVSVRHPHSTLHVTIRDASQVPLAKCVSRSE
jgi:hypothetical protein